MTSTPCPFGEPPMSKRQCLSSISNRMYVVEATEDEAQNETLSSTVTEQHPTTSISLESTNVVIEQSSSTFNFGSTHLKKLRNEIERKVGMSLLTPEGMLYLHLSNCVRITKCESHLKNLSREIKELSSRTTTYGEAKSDKTSWKAIENLEDYINFPYDEKKNVLVSEKFSPDSQQLIRYYE